MICNKCGLSAPAEQFSKLNISKDRTRGICRGCKQRADQEFRQRRKDKEESLPHFELTPNLLIKKQKARIGVLVLNNFVDRTSSKGKNYKPSQGLKAILSELKEPYDFCPPASINQYEYVLVSLTSVMDVENLVYNLEMYAPPPTAKLVIGGFGVCNIRLLIPYIDIAVFGRAEGQINQVLAGVNYGNVWRKADDPELAGRYEMRQPRYLVSGETSVGCKYRCRFCQYAHIRLGDGKYDPGMTVQETDWSSLEITSPGRYNSAWDGWSTDTWHKVNKPVSKATIEKKLVGLGELGGTVFIKLFQIIGYPWETPETILSDIEDIGLLLKEIDDHLKCRVVLSFLCTPFGAEPLTPMELDQVDISTNWRDIIGDKMVYEGRNIKAFVLPMMSGSYNLVKRMLIHRGQTQHLDLFKKVCFSRELLKLPERLRVSWLLEYNALPVNLFEHQQTLATDYLKIEINEHQQSMQGLGP